MSALLLLFGLVYIAHYSWLRAIFVTAVACFIQASLMESGWGVSLFLCCLITFGLCMLRLHWATVSSWKCWDGVKANLRDYHRVHGPAFRRRVPPRPIWYPRGWRWF